MEETLFVVDASRWGLAARRERLAPALTSRSGMRSDRARLVWPGVVRAVFVAVWESRWICARGFPK